MIRLVCTFTIAVACAYLGAYWEGAKIQSTCESDDQVTTINGAKYLCFSQRQIEQMRRRHEREA